MQTKQALIGIAISCLIFGLISGYTAGRALSNNGHPAPKPRQAPEARMVDHLDLICELGEQGWPNDLQEWSNRYMQHIGYATFDGNRVRLAQAMTQSEQGAVVCEGLDWLKRLHTQKEAGTKFVEIAQSLTTDKRSSQHLTSVGRHAELLLQSAD